MRVIFIETFHLRTGGQIKKCAKKKIRSQKGHKIYRYLDVGRTKAGQIEVCLQWPWHRANEVQYKNSVRPLWRAIP